MRASTSVSDNVPIARSTLSPFTNANAGWPDTWNLENRSPPVSSTVGKVIPWRAMNWVYEPVSPAHATPTNETLSAYFLLHASTEGASLLQVSQPGAQNQNTTGRCATTASMSKLAPPTSDTGAYLPDSPATDEAVSARVVDGNGSAFSFMSERKPKKKIANTTTPISAALCTTNRTTKRMT